jgi:hypothetical protein
VFLLLLMRIKRRIRICPVHFDEMRDFLALGLAAGYGVWETIHDLRCEFQMCIWRMLRISGEHIEPRRMTEKHSILMIYEEVESAFQEKRTARHLCFLPASNRSHDIAESEKQSGAAQGRIHCHRLNRYVTKLTGQE